MLSWACTCVSWCAEPGSTSLFVKVVETAAVRSEYLYSQGCSIYRQPFHSVLCYYSGNWIELLWMKLFKLVPVILLERADPFLSYVGRLLRVVNVAALDAGTCLWFVLYKFTIVQSKSLRCYLVPPYAESNVQNDLVLTSHTLVRSVWFLLSEIHFLFCCCAIFRCIHGEFYSCHLPTAASLIRGSCWLETMYIAFAYFEGKCDFNVLCVGKRNRVYNMCEGGIIVQLQIEIIVGLWICTVDCSWSKMLTGQLIL